MRISMRWLGRRGQWVIISPTEPAELRAIGECSLLPESFGADVAWVAHGGWVGVQRKEVKDFIASMGDGRIGQQVAQMKRLNHAYMVIEGRVVWTIDGEMVGDGFGKPMSKAQWRGAIWSIQNDGVQVGYTESLRDTIEYVRQLEGWSRKKKHTSLTKRETVFAPWGEAGNRDYARHLLMGLPGVGVELADRIIDKFGGVPWTWTVTMKELLTVEGIGKKKAERLWMALQPLRT